MKTQQAIKIEYIEQPKAEAPPTALQIRLNANRPSITLKELTDKLEKAFAKRMELIEKNNPAESRFNRFMNTRVTRVNQERERAIRIDTKNTEAVQRHT